MEELWVLVGEFLVQIFLLLATITMGIAIKWIKSNTTLKQRDLIESISYEVVKYAQETFGHLPGTERYDEAARALSTRLKDFGITISAEEIQVHINAAVKELRKEFGDEWYRN